MKRIVMAVVASMLLVGPALAQNVQVGGEQQQRNTQKTTIETTGIGSDGERFKKSETTNINLPTVDLPQVRLNPTGIYQYSGIPCKWIRGKAEVDKPKAVVGPEK
jgi:hypothetical protein